jgi:hypothetical protein
LGASSISVSSLSEAKHKPASLPNVFKRVLVYKKRPYARILYSRKKLKS